MTGGKPAPYYWTRAGAQNGTSGGLHNTTVVDRDFGLHSIDLSCTSLNEFAVGNCGCDAGCADSIVIVNVIVLKKS
jgi:hypothetical protein